MEGLHEEVLVHGRHAQTTAADIEAADILVGSEHVHRAVVAVPVGLHALEDLLAVVKHLGGRIEGKRTVGYDAGVMPGTIPVVHDEHVGGESGAETVIAVRRGRGVGIAGDGDIHPCLLVTAGRAGRHTPDRRIGVLKEVGIARVQAVFLYPMSLL